MHGDRLAARHWAELAAATGLRAGRGLADPGGRRQPSRASVAYLEQALKINPGSARAREGMRWAVSRLGKNLPGPKAAPGPDPRDHPADRAVRTRAAAVLRPPRWIIPLPPGP